MNAYILYMIYSPNKSAIIPENKSVNINDIDIKKLYIDHEIALLFSIFLLNRV